jgi:MFS superfamily sulfate permease-like transporter
MKNRPHSCPMTSRVVIDLRRPRRPTFWMMFMPLATLCCCRRAPSIGIYGSYFPGWLICLVLGIALTVAIHLVLRRLGYEVRLDPLGLVYIAFSITLTCLLWLALFY